MPMPEKRFTDYGKNFGFMHSELPGRMSREQVEVAPTTKKLPAGTVLGIITATGLYAPLNPTANDGSQTAQAILAMGVGISAQPTRVTVGARGFEAAANMLFWPTGISEPGKKAAEQQLAIKQIIVRH